MGSKDSSVTLLAAILDGADFDVAVDGNIDGSGYGNGSGSGNGSGYGDGDGSGSGDGDGDGSGSGYGGGSGSGSGSGSGGGDGAASGYGNGSGNGDLDAEAGSTRVPETIVVVCSDCKDRGSYVDELNAAHLPLGWATISVEDDGPAVKFVLLCRTCVAARRAEQALAKADPL